MTDRISYTFTRNGKARRAKKPDPRLVELVRYLARRAAERDYEELLAADASSPDQFFDKDDSS